MFAVSNLPSAGTTTSNAIFNDGAYNLVNVKYMFYNRIATLSQGACFFDPAKYKTKITRDNKTNFISQVDKNVMNGPNYNALYNDSYVELNTSNPPTINGVVGNYTTNITNKIYADAVIYNNTGSPDIG